MRKSLLTTFIAAVALSASFSLSNAQDFTAIPSGKSTLTATGKLILIRDTRASMGGSGGYSKGSCWKGCFEEYNNCVDRMAKDICVPQMKSCLAVCDSLSGGN